MTKLHNIEQRTFEWYNLRLGKITGSNFKTLITPNGILKKDRQGNLGRTAWKTIYKAIAEELTGLSQDDTYVTAAMEHGIEFEDEAKQEFLKHIGVDKNLNPWQDTGFATVGYLQHFGLSPDFICGEDPREALEIKCPTPTTHVEIIHTGTIPTDWIPQAIGYFVFLEHLTTLHWCSYDYRIRKKPLVHLKIHRADWAERIKNATDSFLEVDEIINNLLK